MYNDLLLLSLSFNYWHCAPNTFAVGCFYVPMAIPTINSNLPCPCRKSWLEMKTKQQGKKEPFPASTHTRVKVSVCDYYVLPRLFCPCAKPTRPRASSRIQCCGRHGWPIERPTPYGVVQFSGLGKSFVYKPPLWLFEGSHSTTVTKTGLFLNRQK
jgi:hypothetical protein